VRDKSVAGNLPVGLRCNDVRELQPERWFGLRFWWKVALASFCAAFGVMR
jgi:hypothetical protein